MTPKRSRRVTAAEFIRELEKDPSYQARVEEAEQRQQFRQEDYGRAAAPVVDELRNVGVEVDRISELRQRRADYPRAVPVLLRWLSQVTESSVKEDIIRTLSVPWAGPDVAAPLIREFHHVASSNSPIAWVIGSALEVVANDAVVDDLIDIATDQSYGRSREMVVAALGNMKDPRAKEILIDLLEDEEVTGYAVMGLGKLKAEEARERIESLLKHPQEWVRKEARKALAKID